jgi:hypothetical protein
MAGTSPAMTMEGRKPSCTSESADYASPILPTGCGSDAYREPVMTIPAVMAGLVPATHVLLQSVHGRRLSILHDQQTQRHLVRRR